MASGKVHAHRSGASGNTAESFALYAAIDQGPGDPGLSRSAISARSPSALIVRRSIDALAPDSRLAERRHLDACKLHGSATFPTVTP
jgi:hypothetical protein